MNRQLKKGATERNHQPSGDDLTSKTKAQKSAPDNSGRTKSVNMTLTEGVLQIAAACMRHRVMTNRTEYFATLAREDWERRGRPDVPQS